MTKLKNTDEKCKCHCHCKIRPCSHWETNGSGLSCPHCHPEKQGDWESRFIQEFCNDHNGEIRFLRGVFYDEKDGAEQIINFIRQLEKQTRESVVEEFVNGLIEASRVGNEYHIEIIGEAVWGIREKLKQKTKE